MSSPARIDPAWVRGEVAKIAEERDDPLGSEIAHCSADELYENVLRHIANGTAEDPQQCASEAIKVKELEIVRYYS